MNRRYLCIIFVIPILMAGCFLHNKSSKMPSQPPTTIVKYKDSVVPTSIGDHNWIPKNGGSSYETGGDYVFEVFAKWDSDRHNTATIFKVFIE